MKEITRPFEDGTLTLQIGETRNKFGKLPCSLIWGELDIFVTFDTVEDAQAFMADTDAVTRVIDQAAHC